MKNGRKHKRILISIFLTLLTNVLCIPLWTECNYGGLVRTLFNKEARLDFVYRGKITETKPFRLNASKPAPSYHWEHGVETKTKRANGSLRARKNWQKTSLLLEALQDGQISVVLMGPVSRDEYGQFYSVLTDWRNLKINGEVIFGDSKTLSLKKYFAKRIPVKEHETLQIEVEFRRHHFTIDDFTFLTAQNFWYLVSGNLLFFFLVYCLVSWSYWTHRGQSRPSDTLLVKRDIIKLISDCYLNVNAVYRRAFWIIFGVLCFAFGFHAIQFMWGNHDWTFLLSDLSWVHFQHIGRYSLTFFRKLFLGGIYLPFIYDIISFLFLALNAVLLCVYWKLQKRVSYFVLCGLILTAQPFTLGLIYYVHMVPETFIGVTFVLVALIISEKFAFEKSSLFKKSALSVLSITLINLSLASYPVLINTCAVAFVGRLLIKSFEWDGSWKQGRTYFVPYTVSALNIVLGSLSYKVMLALVFPPQGDMYNVRTLPLHQLPERLLALCKQSFHQLYGYKFPFISQIGLWVFLCFTILVVLYICLTGNFKQKIVRLILLGGALFATQTAMIVANTHVIAARIELFGLVVFETLMTVLVFTELKKMHNLSVFAAAGVIWISIINDLDCLRVWKLGFDAEKMLWNRVLARMEMQKDFDRNRKYKIVQIGKPISLRSHFYGKSYLSTGFYDNESSLLSFSYDPYWQVFLAYEFYYQTKFRGERLRPDRPNDPKYRAQLKRLWEAGILDKARAWPHENGLIVWKDVILFVTDAKLLEEYRKQLAKEFPRQSQITP